MRSGTSYFNSTLFFKAITRFWPLWALYTFIWAIILPLQILSTALNQSRMESHARLMEELWDLAQSVIQRPNSVGLGLALVFSVACAMAMFGYLYTSRSACMMHALPVRREGLFLTHYLAGLGFLIVPHLIIYALTASIELALGCLALEPLTQWLLLQSGICFFFYSFSVFCAMFTGSLMALPVFYGILNVLPLGVSSLINAICGLFWYGYEGFSETVWVAVRWLTPFINLKEALYWQWTEEGQPVLNQPAVVGIYVVVGLVLTAAALQVYRIRHMESAGDVVAINLVRPLFKYGVAVCTGLAGGLGMYMLLYMGSDTVLMVAIVLWSVIGYFIGEMLLKKSFRVLGAWKGAAALAAVMALLCLSVSMDWYGYQSYIPNADQVSRIGLRMRNEPDDGANSHIELEDAERISQVIELHRQIIERGDQRSDSHANTQYVRITYTMDNGRTISRSYNSVPIYEEKLQQEGSLEQLAQGILDQRDVVEQMYHIPDPKDWRIAGVYLSDVWDTENQSYTNLPIEDGYDKLRDAVQKDFTEGNLGKRYFVGFSQERKENTYLTDLSFELVGAITTNEEDTAWNTWQITLTPQATHTLTVLRELGVLSETYQLRTHAEEEEIRGMEEAGIPYGEGGPAASTQVLG